MFGPTTPLSPTPSSHGADIFLIISKQSTLMCIFWFPMYYRCCCCLGFWSPYEFHIKIAVIYQHFALLPFCVNVTLIKVVSFLRTSTSEMSVSSQFRGTCPLMHNFTKIGHFACVMLMNLQTDRSARFRGEGTVSRLLIF
jgi:hypothetical protein